MSETNGLYKTERKRSGFPLKLVSFFLSLLFLVTSVPVFASSDLESPVLPRDGGVFRFRNIKTGLYLSVYDSNAKKTPCKTYLAKSAPADQHQFFRLLRNDNGSWTVVPKSQSEAYCISCTAGDNTGAALELGKIGSVSSGSGFDLTAVGDAWTIAPAEGANIDAVLSATDETDSSKNHLVRIENYEYGNDSQKWILEPVLTEKITTAFEHTTIGTYTTGKIFARKFPDDSAENDIVWTSDNESVVLVSEDGEYCAMSPGTAHLTASADGCSRTVTVEVSDSSCFTWYSQNSITVSDWDGSLLVNQKFYAEGRSKKFAADIDSGTNSWISSGCALCSLAMVFHNLNATLTKGYDYRSGQDGNLPADPYTVALSNAGSYGVKSDSSTISGSPIYMRWSAAAGRFNVDGKSIAFKKYYSPTKKAVSDMLARHPAGIIVVYQRGTGETHYLVVSGIVNPQEKVSSKLQFIVYDPSAYEPSKGDGVPFSSTYTATKFGYIYAAYAFDVSDRF